MKTALGSLGRGCVIGAKGALVVAIVVVAAADLDALRRWSVDSPTRHPVAFGEPSESLVGAMPASVAWATVPAEGGWVFGGLSWKVSCRTVRKNDLGAALEAPIPEPGRLGVDAVVPIGEHRTLLQLLRRSGATRRRDGSLSIWIHELAGLRLVVASLGDGPSAQILQARCACADGERCFVIDAEPVVGRRGASVRDASPRLPGGSKRIAARFDADGSLRAAVWNCPASAAGSLLAVWEAAGWKAARWEDGGGSAAPRGTLRRGAAAFDFEARPRREGGVCVFLVATGPRGRFFPDRSPAAYTPAASSRPASRTTRLVASSDV